MPNTSYYLYQKWEQRGEQDWIPAFPNEYSIDGDGTMPLSAKTINDPACGYIPPSEPIYRWVNIDPSIDWVCDEEPVSPTPTFDGKFKATYTGGITYSAECDSNTTITFYDAHPSGYEYSSMTSVIIGNCATEIATFAFSGCSNLSSVTFSDTVTNTGIWAFTGCTNLTSVSIGSGMEYIDQQSFANCVSLSSVTIPDNVRGISAGAFSGCSNLQSVTVKRTIPPSITFMSGNWSAFDDTNNCPIYVPSGSVDTYKSEEGWSDYASRIQAIPASMATYSKYYKQQKQVSYDNGNTWGNLNEYRKGELIESYSTDCGYIGQLERWINTGTTCEGYDKYYIQVKEISDDGVNWTRTSDTQLGSIIEHNSTDCGYVTPIKWIATYSDSASYSAACNFSTTLTSGETKGNGYNFDLMTSAVVGDCVTKIGQGAFYQNCNTLTSVTLSDSVTVIDENAFFNCDSLTSINIPSGVTTIGDFSFAFCTRLPSITISNGVTNIGTQAFGSCYSFTSITIPSSVTSIGHWAFYECSGLTSITCLATTPPSAVTFPYVPWEAFDSTNDCPIYVPAESVEAYKSATNWSTYASRIQAIPSV